MILQFFRIPLVIKFKNHLLTNKKKYAQKKILTQHLLHGKNGSNCLYFPEKKTNNEFLIFQLKLNALKQHHEELA